MDTGAVGAAITLITPLIEHAEQQAALGAPNAYADPNGNLAAVTLPAAVTEVAAQAALKALDAYADPNGNLTETTLSAALTETAAYAADILTQLNALDASTDTRYAFANFYAITNMLLRSYEERITILEAQVAAL